jgi:hypothetical protein
VEPVSVVGLAPAGREAIMFACSCEYAMRPVPVLDVPMAAGMTPPTDGVVHSDDPPPPPQADELLPPAPPL